MVYSTGIFISFASIIGLGIFIGGFFKSYRIFLKQEEEWKSSRILSEQKIVAEMKQITANNEKQSKVIDNMIEKVNDLRVDVAVLLQKVA